MLITSLKDRKTWVVLGIAVLVVTVTVVVCVFLRGYVADGGAIEGRSTYTSSAVSTNGYLCADIGKDILRKNGSAVEAAIAALLCEGVVCIQSMGVGGGFLMTGYLRANRRAWALNARETAPAAATEDMFKKNANLSREGGLAVAVPGELKGYWEAFLRFGSGNVKWSELVEPSAIICEKGFKVSKYLASVLTENEDVIKRSKSLSDILVNPATGRVWKKGNVLRRPQLGKTLRSIAKNGVDVFYNGTMGDDLVKDVKDFGGIITKDDLKNYRVRWEEPVNTTLSDGTTLYSSPPPGSGVLLAFMFNVLGKSVSHREKLDAVTLQRIVETFKHAYARRTQLGDPHFDDSVRKVAEDLLSKDYARSVREKIRDDRTYQDPKHYGAIFSQKEDHGTAHISVLAPNGDAVSVTSTINLLFGAKMVSPSTGIVLNDEMDDFSIPEVTNFFSVPPSPANSIKPGKRPFSSMCPSIFVDSKGDVRLVVGAAGGTKITTGTALVAMNNLWFGDSIKQAIGRRRVHHQLLPMVLETEEGFDKNIVLEMKRIGHKVKQFPLGGATVTGIAVQGGVIDAHSDLRRGGVTAGF